MRAANGIEGLKRTKSTRSRAVGKRPFHNKLENENVLSNRSVLPQWLVGTEVRFSLPPTDLATSPPAQSRSRTAR